MNFLRKYNPFVVPFRDNRDLAYAAKHRAESGIAFHGGVTLDHFRGGKLIHTQTGSNIFTTEGRNYLLEVMFGVTSKAGAAIWYVGIFDQAVTPILTNTAAACLGNAGTYGECLDADYTPNTNKPVYTIAAAGSSICTNAASPAVFTIVIASNTICGAFLSNTALKTSNAGVLMCAKAFSPTRAVITADVLSVTYVITLTSS